MSNHAEEQELPGALGVLSAVFGDGPTDVPARADGLSMDDLRRYVAGHIERLLRDRPAELLSILYRVDVAERRVRYVFETAPHNEIAMRLADLLIERQLQKERTRRAYRHV